MTSEYRTYHIEEFILVEICSKMHCFYGSRPRPLITIRAMCVLFLGQFKVSDANNCSFPWHEIDVDRQDASLHRIVKLIMAEGLMQIDRGKVAAILFRTRV